MLNEHKRAQQVLTTALHLIRRYPHPVVEGELQLRRALLAMNQDKVAQAVRLFRQALPLIEATGTRDRVAYLLLPGGQSLTMCGMYEEAQLWLERGTQLGEETDSNFLISSGLQLLGWLNLSTGMWNKALCYLERGKLLASQHDLRDRLLECMILEGQIYLYRGNYRQSERLFMQIMDLAQLHNIDRALFQSQHYLAYHALMQGMVDKAIRYHEGRDVTGEPIQFISQALDRLSSAEWWAMLGDTRKAAQQSMDTNLLLASIQQSLAYIKKNAQLHYLPFAYRVSAMVSYALGDLEASRKWASSGLKIGQRIGRVPETARCFFWRGKAEHQLNTQSKRAIRDFNIAASLFKHLDARPELELVEALLKAGH